MGAFPIVERSLFTAWLTAAAIFGLGARADAGTAPVSLGEVRVEKSDAELERAFRGALATELDRLQIAAKPNERYVLSAALVTTTTRERSGQAESVAVVNATLRRAPGGALHAVIRGRAQVVDEPNRPVELSAMRAAVRSTVRRVPEAIK